MDRVKRLKMQKEFLIQAAYWLVWICIVVWIIKYIGPVLLPFVLAFLVAWGLSYPVEYVTKWLHLNRSMVSVFVVVLFYVLIAAAIYFLGIKMMAFIQQFYAYITYFFTGTIIPLAQDFCSWWNGLLGVTEQMAMQTPDGMPAEIASQAGEMLSGVSVKVIDNVSDIASNIPRLCMNILLTVIATVFTEVEYEEVVLFLERQIPEGWKNTTAEIRTGILELAGKCMLSYLLIMLLTYAELVVGFWLLGIEGAFVIAFIIAVLDILPVLGTGTILLPWMIAAFMSGNLKQGIGILLLYLVITVVRNIVEPRLVGSQIGLSPVVMLPCMILGLHFFGLPGLFIVPYGTAFLKSLNDRGVIHIFNRNE